MLELLACRLNGDILYAKNYERGSRLLQLFVDVAELRFFDSQCILLEIVVVIMYIIRNFDVHCL